MLRSLGALKWPVLLAALLVGVLTLTMGDSARAVALSAAPPTSRAAPPVGAGYRWGVPIASLGVCSQANTALFPSIRGGWNQAQTFASSTVDSDPGTNPVYPIVLRFDEPCDSGSTSTSGSGRLLWAGLRKVIAGMPFTSGARSSNIYVKSTGLDSAGVTLSRTVTCQTTEWSTTQTTITPNPATGNFVTFGNGDSSYISGVVTGTNTACARLVAFQLVVCDGQLAAPQPSYAGHTCVLAEWSAERWYQSQFETWNYDERLGPLGSTVDSLLCSLPGVVYAACAEILSGIHVTTYDDWCGSPPAMEWLDFSWIPETIGYYAHCLFVPPDGVRADALKALVLSPPIEATMDVASALNAYRFTEGCGTILAVPPLPVAPAFHLDISTCGWSSWVATPKALLSLIIYALFGWWAINFTIRLFLAAVKIVPVPLPLVTEAALGPVPPSLL